MGNNLEAGFIVQFNRAINEQELNKIANVQSHKLKDKVYYELNTGNTIFLAFPEKTIMLVSSRQDILLTMLEANNANGKLSSEMREMVDKISHSEMWFACNLNSSGFSTLRTELNRVNLGPYKKEFSELRGLTLNYIDHSAYVTFDVGFLLGNSKQAHNVYKTLDSEFDQIRKELRHNKFLLNKLPPGSEDVLSNLRSDCQGSLLRVGVKMDSNFISKFNPMNGASFMPKFGGLGQNQGMPNPANQYPNRNQPPGYQAPNGMMPNTPPNNMPRNPYPMNPGSSIVNPYPFPYNLIRLGKSL